MKSIIFVTGNSRKVLQGQTVLDQFGIQLQPRDLDIAEIQAHDPLQIALAKAQAAYEQLQKPLVICDHSWAFRALRGFPGGYMKDINHWFTAQDFLALMQGKQDRRVTLTEVVVYVDAAQTKTFSEQFGGMIIDEARGTGNVSGEQVTVFDGQTETIAEIIDRGGHARDIYKSAWQPFGEWYAAKD